MKKVKAILTIFFHSFVPQEIYFPKLLHTRLQFSFKYYLLIVSFLACIFSGILLYHFSPGKVSDYKNAILDTISTFPIDSEIKISKGTLTSNQNKPLFLWVYYKNSPFFAFMVDTKSMLDTTYIRLPFIFFGSNQMQFSYKGYSSTRLYDSSLDGPISKDTILSIISYVNNGFSTFLIGFYFILLIIIPFVFIVTSTLFILLSSGMVYILLRTFIPHIHFKKCLQAGAHGTHIPLIISILLYSLFPIVANTLIVTFSLIFIFTLVATYEMYSGSFAHSRGR